MVIIYLNSSKQLLKQTEIRMSAIGGIYNFADDFVEETTLAELGRSLESLGPEGGGNFNSGPVGMVYRALHITKESHDEIQPLVSATGQILCWDGRLDNRVELIAILRDELRGDFTDAGIVMAAYLKWGLDFLPKLIADFALSLWDPSLRSLILARDVIGSRDLYYHVAHRGAIWSTDLKQLIHVSRVKPEVDENYIAGYFTRLPQSSESPFKNIDVVPPAHAVIIKNGDVQVRRFWGLNPDHELRYRSDAEYEDHFRHLFEEAVRCCLRSDRPVWSDLSGGLDSSSIVCMADQLIKTSKSEAPVLETVSCIRDESVSSNELKFVRYVEERIGKQGYHVRESNFPVLSAEAVAVSPIPNALDIFASYHQHVNQLMTANGARVRLCGNGGDQIFNSLPAPLGGLADSLVRGRFLQLHQDLCAWSRDRNKPYLKLLWQDAVEPFLSPKLQLLFRRDLTQQFSELYDPGFIKRTRLVERMLSPRDPFGFRLPSSRRQSVSFLTTVRSISAGYARALLHGTELRFPILYRPLVEFMQAIPPDQRIRPGEKRSLQRRALKHVLPPEVLNRKGKGNPSEAIFRSVTREYARLHSLLSDSHVARYGYVDQQTVMRALERSRYGDKRISDIFRIIPLELWLRSLDQYGPTAEVNAAVMGSPEACPAAA
jgi:asparagine synthase (glutamine-hydrolysing)